MGLIFLNNTHMLLSFIHVDFKVCVDSSSPTHNAILQYIYIKVL